MKKYILVISIILFQQLIIAQSYVSPNDSTSIDQQLDSHFGIDYEIYDMIFVDSLEVNYDNNRKLITDYYGTLDDCIVFTANIKGALKNAKNVVGVYRAGQIIWYSDYIVPDDLIYSGGKINVIFDFNNDGLVEIMTEWTSYSGGRYELKSLYIHSWDGNQGTLSVELDEEGSLITCYVGKEYDYIDIQGDGVFEIINYMGIEEDYPEVFEWDGTNYVKSTIELETTEMCFPRNNFTPIVTAVVTKEGNAFRYNYKVENSASSAQSINKFDVYGSESGEKYIENYYSSVNTTFKNWRGDERRNSVTWRGRSIKPGKSLDGFSYISLGLPDIGFAYLRGFNYEGPDCYADDYKSNSVKMKTIVAKLPPLPFIPIDFLNSLTTYTDSSYALGWIKDEQTRDKYNNYFSTAKTYLEQGDSTSARSELQKVLTDCNTDSSSTLTTEAYALLYFNTEYLVNKLPEAPAVEGLAVKLEDSQGNLLQGGSLQYYDGGWKVAIDNGDGTFTVQTERTTVSLKMVYVGGSQQVNNVTVGSTPYIFQTVNTTVKLLNSQGAPIDTGAVKYYASGWKDFGTTQNGVTTKELLPVKYTFKMNHEGGSINKEQGIDTNSTVIFQTVNVEVQLKDSQGNLLNGGFAKYYASGWKDFGEAANGTVTKELLPREYTFRMEYGGAGIDQKQDIGTDPVLVFQTVNTEVQLKDSQGNLLDGGNVKYYASGWRDFGQATNGTVTKELLPREYTFRMEYAGGSIDKKENISIDPVVVFQTVSAEVQLKDTQGNLLSGGVAKYYASGWKDFGQATNGTVTKELLPREYTFRMEYAGASIDKKQDIGTNPVVVFQTVNAEVQLKDSQGNLLDGGNVKYYASGWKDFGEAANGTVTKELLPREYTFRMEYAGASIDKKQDIGTNPAVVFQTVNAEVQLKDSQGNLLEGGNVKYYASGWRDFGQATNGTVRKELLPREYTFRMEYGGASLEQKQDISSLSPVVFATVNCIVRVVDGSNQTIDNAIASYYASGWKEIGNTTNGEVNKELLPKNYSFRVNYNGINKDKQQDITSNNIVEFVFE